MERLHSAQGNLLKGIDNKTVKVHIFEMATKIDKIFTVNLTFTTQSQIYTEDFIIFCGLFRKHEL